MLTHHASNGCNLIPGDILASGTISGPQPSSAVCPLKITQRGTVPLKLPTGELLQFLADGDEIILRAHCHREGLPVIAFDECRVTLLPAI